LNERILAKLKILTSGNAGDEATLSLVLDILIEKIKAYCNIFDIPTELELIIVEMMADYSKSLATGGQDTVNMGEIKAITRGKTRIEYNVGTTTKIVSVGDLIDKYKKQLKRFRKVGSVSMNDKVGD
jgi:DNA-directed RNA polymerase alpha subunit